MIVSARGGERARIVSWPQPYVENPYLSKLADALACLHVTTETHRFLAALAARPTRARWLHLHWPEWMLRDASRTRAHARARWLFALLDAFRLRGLRIAWTAHNLVGHDEPHEDLARRYRRALLDRCDLVIGHFADAEPPLRALGYRSRFAWCEHPSFVDHGDLAVDRTIAREQMGISGDDLVLAAIGAIEPYKNYERLAHAFSMNEDPGSRLVIAGAPRFVETVRALRAIADRDARITLHLEHVSDARVAEILAAADAFVISHRQFFTSGSAVLALGHGCPIVGPPVHHLKELVGRSFFVPLYAIDDVRQTITSVRAIPAGARSEAREHVRPWTWLRMARTIIDAMGFGDASS